MYLMQHVETSHMIFSLLYSFGILVKSLVCLIFPCYRVPLFCFFNLSFCIIYTYVDVAIIFYLLDSKLSLNNCYHNWIYHVRIGFYKVLSFFFLNFSRIIS